MFQRMLLVLLTTISTYSFGYDSSGVSSDIDASALREGFSRRSIGYSSKHIDNSIDENSYLIGGGDEFSISLKAMSLVSYNGAVNSNGDLFIPNLGIVELGKITLREAKAVIAEKLKTILGKEVYVSLSNTKNATITITGLVSSPGTYEHSGTYRLLDAILMANDDSIPPMSVMNLRAVKCVNQGVEQHFDLFKYLQNGDLSQNPYIYPGDKIDIKPVRRKVFLTGEAILKENWISILPDEDLKSFVSLFDLNASADIENIIVKRNNRDTRYSEIITVSFENYTPVSLQDNDMIVVTRKENYPEIQQVSITGEITRQGSYPIQKDAATAKELIRLAGGATTYGDMKRAVILRHGKALPKNFSAVEVRPEINSAFSMSNIKNDYTVIRISERDVLLEHGDQIYIPKKDQFVYLSGSVKNPGGIPFQDGENLSYYLRKAGGLQRNADRQNIVVVSKYANATVTKDAENIEEGDIIMVPVSRQNRFLSSVILPIIQATATTVGVILAIYSTATK